MQGHQNERRAEHAAGQPSGSGQAPTPNSRRDGQPGPEGRAEAGRRQEHEPGHEEQRTHGDEGPGRAGKPTEGKGPEREGERADEADDHAGEGPSSFAATTFAAQAEGKAIELAEQQRRAKRERKAERRRRREERQQRAERQPGTYM